MEHDFEAMSSLALLPFPLPHSPWYRLQEERPLSLEDLRDFTSFLLNNGIDQSHRLAEAEEYVVAVGGCAVLESVQEYGIAEDTGEAGREREFALRFLGARRGGFLQGILFRTGEGISLFTSG